MITMPVLVEVKGPLYRGYVNFFESKHEALEYKWKQLMRITKQYEILKEPLPEDYSEQITLMKKEQENEEKDIQK